MCFAPYVSLATFVIEFLLALFFLLKDPRDNLNRIIALMSFLLGVYQLNEFLICTTGAGVFANLAFATTAILPALAITLVLTLFRKRIRFYWHALIYAPAVFFIIMFAFSVQLNAFTICMSVFIQYPWLGVLSQFFGLYYWIYLVAAVVLFFAVSLRPISIYEKRMAYLGMLGILIFTVPTYIFLIFLPALKVQTPSILCEFALLFAIELLFVLRYKEKHKLKY